MFASVVSLCDIKPGLVPLDASNIERSIYDIINFRFVQNKYDKTNKGKKMKRRKTPHGWCLRKPIVRWLQPRINMPSSFAQFFLSFCFRVCVCARVNISVCIECATHLAMKYIFLFYNFTCTFTVAATHTTSREIILPMQMLFPTHFTVSTSIFRSTGCPIESAEMLCGKYNFLFRHLNSQRKIDEMIY